MMRCVSEYSTESSTIGRIGAVVIRVRSVRQSARDEMRRRRFEREIEWRSENALRIHAELHGRELLETLAQLFSCSFLGERAEKNVATIGENVERVRRPV